MAKMNYQPDEREGNIYFREKPHTHSRWKKKTEQKFERVDFHLSLR